MKRISILVFYLSVSAIVCGLIVWHAFQWHLSGMYVEMLNWLNTGKNYITAIYNLGLILILSIALSFLLQNITELFDDGNKMGKKR